MFIQQWPSHLQRIFKLAQDKNHKIELSLTAEQKDRVGGNLLFYEVEQMTEISRTHPDYPDDLVDILARQRALEIAARSK